MATEQAIRNISDTAIWAARYRARETERKGALFRGPFARRLAGERGDRIAVTMHAHDEHEWAWVIVLILGLTFSILVSAL
jgi:O-methyltransferase involved in polyketide biosynthesis